MSQRPSGYVRKPDESYETIAWPICALLTVLRPAPIGRVWDPCDRGSGQLVATLRAQGLDAIGTGSDFLAITKPPSNVSDVLTNPPYGKGGRLAVKFIEHALELEIPRIAMLLRVDFDSALTRQHLFRHNPSFAGKITLLHRIKWFDGPSSPSDNHAWFIWRRAHIGLPVLRYIARTEAHANNELAPEMEPVA